METNGGESVGGGESIEDNEGSCRGSMENRRQ